MENFAQQNALKSVARQCNIEIGKHKRKLKTMQPEEIMALMAPFVEVAKGLGFSKTWLKIEIARINGVIQ